MLSKTASRIATAASVTAATAGLALAGAGSAAASQFTSVPLAPGQGVCVSQYAGFQVRADGSATGAGAKFKLLYNGQVVDSTPSRVNYWGAERRSPYGNFPGPGYYSACAQNTGTTNTTVSLQLRTDGEF